MSLVSRFQNLISYYSTSSSFLKSDLRFCLFENSSHGVVKAQVTKIIYH